jgi:hypothetical protein
MSLCPLRDPIRRIERSIFPVVIRQNRSVVPLLSMRGNWRSGPKGEVRWPWTVNRMIGWSLGRLWQSS